MSQMNQSGIAQRHLVPSLSERDRAVIELVGRFRQLGAGHVHAALFADCASKTPCDRALKRLCDRGYLVRLSRPVGGDGGGSNQYVYQLGRAGWRLLERPGSYWAARAINLHALMIAECFVQLRDAEQQGRLKLLRFDAEPTSHRTVDTIQLTPDAYVEVGLPYRQLRYSLFLEVDRGSEHADVIREKCVRYWHAYQQWTEEYFPYVVFVVPDGKRRQEIGRTVAGGPEPAQTLFCIFELASLAGDIHRNLQ